MAERYLPVAKCREAHIGSRIRQEPREIPMLTCSQKKRGLVLSDNAGLARAIALNLSSHLEIEIVIAGWAPEREAYDIRSIGCDLVIVALSSLSPESAEIGPTASLVANSGDIPILIISEQPPTPEEAGRIAHLEFPFDIDQLHAHVDDILFRRAIVDTCQQMEWQNAAARGHPVRTTVNVETR
jgi:hypothetical protein